MLKNRLLFEENQAALSLLGVNSVNFPTFGRLSKEVRKMVFGVIPLTVLFSNAASAQSNQIVTKDAPNGDSSIELPNDKLKCSEQPKFVFNPTDRPSNSPAGLKLKTSEISNSKNDEIPLLYLFLASGGLMAIYSLYMAACALKGWLFGKSRSKKPDDYKSSLLTEQLELIKKQHRQEVNSMQTEINYQKQEVLRLEETIYNFNSRSAKSDQENSRLIAEINELKDLVEKLSEANRKLKSVEGFKNASVLVSANEMACKIEEMASSFRRDMQSMLEVDSQTDAQNHHLRLIFSVNPKLTNLIADLKSELEMVTARWQSDDLPLEERENNQRVILPLLLEFEALEKMFTEGLFSSCLEAAFKLTGKIELLMAMNDESSENNADVAEVWANFIRSENVPLDWIDSKSKKLINFFTVLGLSEKSVWSSDFRDEMIKAYRKIVAQCHPDRGGDNEQFVLLNKARDIFNDQYLTGQYIRTLNAYRTIFPNQ